MASWGLPLIGAVQETPVTGGDLTLTEPANVQPGHLLVACISYRSNAAFALPAGGGWAWSVTQQSSGDTDATNGIASIAQAYIVRGASPPDLTFTRTAGNVAQGVILAYPGVNRSTPYDKGSSATLASASATVTAPTLSTAEANELLVAHTAHGDTYTDPAVSAFDAATDPTTGSGTTTDTTNPPLAGTWKRRFTAVTGTGCDTGIGVADAVRATAGATGQFQATVGGSARHCMAVGAFRLDTTAPVLSNQTVGSITQDGGTPAVDTDEGVGTVYMVVVPDGDTPSVAQIKAGQRSNGTAALAAENLPVTATGTQTFSAVTGLSGGTAYDVWFVQTDHASNDATAVKADFTTSSAAQNVDATPAVATFTVPSPTVEPGEVTVTATAPSSTFTVPAPASVTNAGAFDNYRRAVIDGFVSAQGEAAGWNAQRANIPVTALERISDSVARLTLPPLSGFNITAQETVTATVPADATSAGEDIVATPSFTIDAVSAQDVDATPAVGTFTVPSPSVVLGDVTVSATPAVATFTVPDATPVPGDVSVSATPALATFTVPDVTPVPGEATVTATPAVGTFAVPDVTPVPGDVAVETTPAFGTFSVPDITPVFGDVSVSATPAVGTFTVPDPSLTLGLDVSATPAFATFTVPDITPEFGEVTVTVTPATASFWIDDPTPVVGDVTLTLTAAVGTFGVPDVVAEVGATSVDATPAWATFGVPDITALLGDLTVETTAAYATFGIDAPSLTTDLTIETTPAVATFGIPNVTAEVGATNVETTPAFSSFVVPAVEVVPGDVTRTATPAVATFTVPDVTPVAGEATVETTPAFATFTVPSPEVGSILTVTATSASASFGVPDITPVYGDVTVEATPAVVQVGVPAVEVQPGAVTVSATSASASFVVLTPTVTIPAPFGPAAWESGNRIVLASRVRHLIWQRLRAIRPPARKRWLILEENMATLPAFDVKRPAETDVLTFDLVNLLETGETIVSAPFTVAVKTGTDQNVGSMLQGNAVISGATVSHQIKAGVSGATYLVTALVTTSTARILQPAATLPVAAPA